MTSWFDTAPPVLAVIAASVPLAVFWRAVFIYYLASIAWYQTRPPFQPVKETTTP